MTAPIIQVRDVVLRYGDFTALDRVSLDVFEGEVIVVCGPSGSGKSTLLRCLNGLETFQEGEVIVDGENVATCRNLPALRRRINHITGKLLHQIHTSVARS